METGRFGYRTVINPVFTEIIRFLVASMYGSLYNGYRTVIV